MKKVAVIFEGNIHDRKGLINAVLERTKGLKFTSEFEVDLFCIMSYENALIRKLRHTSYMKKNTCEYVDGLKINILWNEFSLLDYLLEIKLHKRSYYKRKWIKVCANYFINYNLIITHSYSASLIGFHLKREYNIPYCVTWHGSDIHTAPVNNKYVKNDTKQILESADINFFVSKALLNSAKKIADYNEDTWLVSYNGASTIFRKFSKKEKDVLARKYGIQLGVKVVGFVGGLVTIKNANLLPSIFNEIRLKYKGDIRFLIIGDGKLRRGIEEQLKADYQDLNCSLLGNMSPQEVNELMNCMDILVLPSKNEGLPLVVVEALKCGTNVVSTDVGGIKEVIGSEYVIPLDENLIENMSYKCVEILESDAQPPLLPQCFNWENTINFEKEVYNSFLKNKEDCC